MGTRRLRMGKNLSMKEIISIIAMFAATFTAAANNWHDTDLGWVYGDQPLDGWNLIAKIDQWAYFYVPPTLYLTVTEAGTPEVVGVYRYVDSDTWHSAAPDGVTYFQFFESRFDTPYWQLRRASTIYYQGSGDHEGPQSVEDWQVIKGSLPLPAITLDP